MALTKFELVSVALMKLGADPIQSFDDPTTIAKSAGKIYEHEKRRILGSYVWKFSLKYASLPRLAAAPLMQWEYQFSLPPDRISDNMFQVFNTDKVDAYSTPHYTVQDNKLLSNFEEIWVRYQYDIDESMFPTYFEALMVKVMMAEMAFLVTNSSSKEAELKQEVYGTPSEMGRGGLYAQTMAIDSKDTPLVKINDFTLIEGRYSSQGL
jgi:hypothetical protein